ncbi:MAG: hypothetical protein HYY58_03050 [Candidatus Omnitrophica bacterium]|nr:hypothetical protein [Candidatus Omnitrophota bacterium]
MKHARQIFDFGFWILDYARHVNLKSKIQNLKFPALHIAFLTSLTAMLTLAGAVMACPLCKESLFDPTQLQQKLSMAKGYALSIGLLLAMPAGLVGALALLIVRAQRHHPRPQGRP